MRLCVRLGGLAVLLVGIAVALVHLRTDTVCAGHRLHSLFREKRDLEKSCSRLELTVAEFKSPQRLRQEVHEWQAASDGAGGGPGFAPAQRGSALAEPDAGSPPSFLAERGNGAPP
jgi:hypothetical protein